MLLRAAGLVKEYGRGTARCRAVDGVDLDVDVADFVAVMGPSGSGKSTLLNLLAGIDTPDEGDVLLDGESVPARPERERTQLRRARIGFVFQQFHLVPMLTALENVALPLTIARMSRPDRHSTAMAMLERVGLAERAHVRAPDLSGGEQQRVAIARALVHAPSIVLADEPTGNLDSRTGLGIMRLLADTRQSLGVALVVVTHDARMASTADRVVRMVDGRLDERPHELRRPRVARRAAPTAMSSPS